MEEDARKVRKHRKRVDNIGKRKDDGQDHTAGKNNMLLDEVAGNARRHMRRVEGGWTFQGWVKSLPVHWPIVEALQLPCRPANKPPLNYLKELSKEKLER